MDETEIHLKRRPTYFLKKNTLINLVKPTITQWLQRKQKRTDIRGEKKAKEKKKEVKVYKIKQKTLTRLSDRGNICCIIQGWPNFLNRGSTYSKLQF